MSSGFWSEGAPVCSNRPLQSVRNAREGPRASFVAGGFSELLETADLVGSRRSS